MEGLKFSSIPTIQNYDKSALKAQSSFLKSSSQQVSLTPASKSEQNAKPDSDRKYSDVIVISPGSRTLRFGLASDAKPHEAAHAIARKMHRACESPSRTSSENGDAGREIADAGHPTSVPSAGKRINRGIFPTYNYRDDLDSVLGRFKDIIDSRLELNKLEVVSDAQEQIRSYNKVSQVAVLPDYNDPDETDWIRDSDSDFVVGNKALKVEALNIKGYDGADREEYTWELFYPLRHGCLNVTSYHSIRHCMEDMMLIWKSLIETELNIPEKQFASYLVVLVIPDIFNKQQVCDTVTALLLGLKFRAVTFIQESTAAAFAAGATSACIVNIGAQQTTVACVDDGVCISDSRFNVKYGGDDVTRFLFEILKRSNFPSTDIDIYDTVSGWILIEKIKEKCCTLSEVGSEFVLPSLLTFLQVDLAIEETAFYVFSPNSPTKKYQMKYYYEVALAPLVIYI